MRNGMRRNQHVLVSLVVTCLLPSAFASAATIRIDFELLTERGFPLTGAHEWSRLFSRFDNTHATIRGARDRDRPGIEQVGTKERPVYRVVGLLTRRNRLQLPGPNEFSLSDRAGVEAWIEKLRTVGVPRDAETELAFGLLDTELVSFHERLERVVAFDTKGVRSGDVCRRLVHNLSISFDVSPAAKNAFGRDELVVDELQGLSHGTSLAAVLRPLGLACAPRRRTAGIELYIAESRELTEWWPVGWPLQQAPFKVAPLLFKQVPVEIADFSLEKALAAIQPRVEIPFLNDHNALAKLQVNLETQLVSFPKRRTSYKKVLDVILFQSGLKAVVRTDDAGKPFLWITSAKR